MIRYVNGKPDGFLPIVIIVIICSIILLILGIIEILSKMEVIT